MGYKPSTRVDGVFDELIVRYGWGMRGDAASLRAEPPDDVDEFVTQLLVIDGRDPAVVDRHDRRLVRRIVIDWIFDPSGRGAKSGLPLVSDLD